MNTKQEMTENLDSIKNKIVKTDEVLKLLGDRSKNLTKVEKKYSILLVKYAEKNEEIQLWMKQCETIEKQLSVCKTTHLPLQHDLTALKTRYESLEQTHHVYVNAAEIKYQSSCQEVVRLSRTVGKLTKKIEHLEAKETIQFGNVKKLKNALRAANVKLNASVLKYEELIANNNKAIAELEEQYKVLEKQRNTDLNHLAQIQVECEQLKKSIQTKSPSKKDSKPAELQKQIENFQRELKCSTDELKILKFSHEKDIKEITKKYELENKLLNNQLAELKLEKPVRNSASQTDIDDCYNFTEILNEMITIPELVSPCSPNDVDAEILPTNLDIIPKFKETSTQTDQHFKQLQEHSQSGPFRINANTTPDSRPDKQRTVFRTVNKVRKNYKTTINKLLRHVKNGTLNTKRILDDVLAASSPIVIVSPRLLKSYLNDNTTVTNPKLLCHKNGDDHSNSYLKMNNKISCFHHRKHRNEYSCCLTCCNDCKLNCISSRNKHGKECCGACLQSKHLNCCSFECNHNNDCNCCSRNDDNQKKVKSSRDYHRNINVRSYYSDDDHNMKLHLNHDLHLNNSASYGINKNQTQQFDSSYMKHRNINDHLTHPHFHYDDTNKIKSSASSVAMCSSHDCSSKMDTTSRNYINETFTSPNLDSNKLCYCIECAQQTKDPSRNNNSKIKNVASCSTNHKEETTSYNMQCSSCDDNHSNAGYNIKKLNSCNLKQHKSFDSEINPIIPPFHHSLPSNKECYFNLLASSRFKRSKYKNKVKQKRKSARQNSKYFISKKYRRILYSSSEEDNDPNTDIENKNSAESQTKSIKSETETGIDLNVMLAKYLKSLPLDKNVMGKALSDTDSGIETLLIKTVKSPITVDINSKQELFRTSKNQVINTTNTEEENHIHFSSIETLSPDHSAIKQKTNKHATNQQVQVSESFQVNDISVNETQNKAKVSKTKKDRTLESKIRESKSIAESLKKTFEENELQSTRNKYSLESKTNKILSSDQQMNQKLTNTEEENQIHFSSIETLLPDHSKTKQKTNKHATNQQVQVSESFQVNDISVNETQNKAKVSKIKKDRTLESKIRESKSIEESLKKTVEENEQQSTQNKDALESKTIMKTEKIVPSDQQQMNQKLTNTEENKIHFSSIKLSPSSTKQNTNKYGTNQQVQVSESFQVRDISVKAKVNQIKKDRTLESEIREPKSIEESLKKTVEENKIQSIRNKYSLEPKKILKTKKKVSSNQQMNQNRRKNSITKVLSKKRNNPSANAADYKKMKLELFGSDIELDTISEGELENNNFSKSPEKCVAHKPKLRLIPKISEELTKNKVSTNPKLTVEKLLLPKVLEMFKQPVKVVHNTVVQPANIVHNTVVQPANIVASAKKNIPLEKERVEELDIKLGRKLVADIATLDWNKELMETVVNCLVKQESSFVARLIVNQVAEDYSQQFDRTFTPPAPLMTITQRKLLVLMVQLEQNGLNNIQQSFLNIAEQRLLSETKVEAVHPLTRLYVAICKLKYDIEQVRMLCCNAAYHMGDLLLPLMFIILTMWGDVLPMAQNSADIHLATVLVHIIQSKSCKIPGYNFKNLGKLLNDYYGYKRGQNTTDEVFTKLIAAYSKNCSNLVYISILILCKNQPSKWTSKQILTHFIPIITDNMKLANQSSLVSMTFVLVSRLVETFDVNLDKGSIKQVHDWLCQFMRDNAVVSPELRKNIECCLSVFFRIFNT